MSKRWCWIAFAKLRAPAKKVAHEGPVPLLATFLGVFLSMQVSTCSRESYNKEMLQGLLRYAYTEVTSISLNVGELEKFVAEETERGMVRLQLPRVSGIQALLGDPLFSKYASDPGMTNISVLASLVNAGTTPGIRTPSVEQGTGATGMIDGRFTVDIVGLEPMQEAKKRVGEYLTLLRRLQVHIAMEQAIVAQAHPAKEIQTCRSGLDQELKDNGHNADLKKHECFEIYSEQIAGQKKMIEEVMR